MHRIVLAVLCVTATTAVGRELSEKLVKLSDTSSSSRQEKPYRPYVENEAVRLYHREIVHPESSYSTVDIYKPDGNNSHGISFNFELRHVPKASPIKSEKYQPRVQRPSTKGVHAPVANADHDAKAAADHSPQAGAPTDYNPSARLQQYTANGPGAESVSNGVHANRNESDKPFRTQEIHQHAPLRPYKQQSAAFNRPPEHKGQEETVKQYAATPSSGPANEPHYTTQQTNHQFTDHNFQDQIGNPYGPSYDTPSTVPTQFYATGDDDKVAYDPVRAAVSAPQPEHHAYPTPHLPPAPHYNGDELADDHAEIEGEGNNRFLPVSSVEATPPVALYFITDPAILDGERGTPIDRHPEDENGPTSHHGSASDTRSHPAHRKTESAHLAREPLSPLENVRHHVAFSSTDGAPPHPMVEAPELGQLAHFTPQIAVDESADSFGGEQLEGAVLTDPHLVYAPSHEFAPSHPPVAAVNRETEQTHSAHHTSSSLEEVQPRPTVNLAGGAYHRLEEAKKNRRPPFIKATVIPSAPAIFPQKPQPEVQLEYGVYQQPDIREDDSHYNQNTPSAEDGPTVAISPLYREKEVTQSKKNSHSFLSTEEAYAPLASHPVQPTPNEYKPTHAELDIEPISGEEPELIDHIPLEHSAKKPEGITEVKDGEKFLPYYYRVTTADSENPQTLFNGNNNFGIFIPAPADDDRQRQPPDEYQPHGLYRANAIHPSSQYDDTEPDFEYVVVEPDFHHPAPPPRRRPHEHIYIDKHPSDYGGPLLRRPTGSNRPTPNPPYDREPVNLSALHGRNRATPLGILEADMLKPTSFYHHPARMYGSKETRSHNSARFQSTVEEHHSEPAAYDVDHRSAPRHKKETVYRLAYAKPKRNHEATHPQDS